jgi:hypothetical protein
LRGEGEGRVSEGGREGERSERTSRKKAANMAVQNVTLAISIMPDTSQTVFVKSRKPFLRIPEDKRFRFFQDILVNILATVLRKEDNTIS